MKITPIHHIPLEAGVQEPLHRRIRGGGREDRLHPRAVARFQSITPTPHDPVAEAEWLEGGIREQTEKTFDNIKTISRCGRRRLEQRRQAQHLHDRRRRTGHPERGLGAPLRSGEPAAANPDRGHRPRPPQDADRDRGGLRDSRELTRILPPVRASRARRWRKERGEREPGRTDVHDGRSSADTACVAADGARSAAAHGHRRRTGAVPRETGTTDDRQGHHETAALRPGFVISTGTPGGAAWGADEALGARKTTRDDVVPAPGYAEASSRSISSSNTTTWLFRTLRYTTVPAENALSPGPTTRTSHPLTLQNRTLWFPMSSMCSSVTGSPLSSIARFSGLTPQGNTPATVVSRKPDRATATPSQSR